jgi:hypothetical protein
MWHENAYGIEGQVDTVHKEAMRLNDSAGYDIAVGLRFPGALNDQFEYMLLATMDQAIGTQLPLQM